MTTTPNDYRLAAFEGLPHKSGVEPLIEHTGALASAAGELAATLVTTLEEYDPDRDQWVTVRCEPAPSKTVRAALTAAFLATLDAAGWQRMEDGWEGERVSFDPAHEPAFALDHENEDLMFAGFWYDETTFVLVKRTLDEAPTGPASVSASHWHPDSRCSGSWYDTFAIVAPRLGVDHHYKDEDGYYVRFEAVDASTPASVAEALDGAVYGWEIFGAEYRLLQAHFLGFDGGEIALLKGFDNPGYSIEDITVHADPDVLKELERRNPAPDPVEAREWLDVIRAQYDERYWPDRDPLVRRLEAIVAEDSDTVGGSR